MSASYKLMWLPDPVKVAPGTCSAVERPPTTAARSRPDRADPDGRSGGQVARPPTFLEAAIGQRGTDPDLGGGAGHGCAGATTAPFAGTLPTTAPSTYRQSALDMSAPGTMGYLDELLVQAGGALTA